MMLPSGCEELKNPSIDVFQVQSRVFGEALKRVNALSEEMKPRNALKKTDKFVRDICLWMYQAENTVTDLKNSLEMAAKNVKAEARHFKETMAMTTEDIICGDVRVMKKTAAEQVNSLVESERELRNRALEKASVVIQKLEVHSAQLDSITSRLLKTLETWLIFASGEIQRFASNLQEHIVSVTDSLTLCDSAQSSTESESSAANSQCTSDSNADDVMLYAKCQWEECKQLCEEKVSLELSGTLDVLDKEIDHISELDREVAFDVEELRNDTELCTRRIQFFSEPFVENLQHDIQYGGLYGAYRDLSNVRSVLKLLSRASTSHREELAATFA